MKILVISFYYKPDLCAGSFRTTAFIEALKANLSAGDYIEVVTTFPNRYKSFRMETKSLEVDGNVIIRRIKIPSHRSGFFDQIHSFVVYFVNVLNVVRKNEYDAVFATSSRLFSAFLGAVISKLKKIPLYLDIRDIFTDTLQSIFASSGLKYSVPFFNLVERFTMTKAGRINLVSEGFASYFRDHYKKDCSFYSNGIDDDFLQSPCIKPATTFGEKIVFTYTGNVGEGQGLEKIVPQIAERFANIEFNIIGDGGRINALRERVGGLTNVKLLKPVNRKELADYYARSDVLFLQLNNYEAFKKVLPSKIFEYAAMCKPIIAGVDGYAKEFMEKNLPDSMIYLPCDIEDFSVKFKTYSREVDIECRKKFISKFKRANIMNEMAQDVINYYRASNAEKR